MRMLQLAVAVSVALCLAACGDDGPTVYGKAPTVDQAFEPGPPPYGGSAGIGNGYAYAQTFTAGLTGTLSSVDVFVAAQGVEDTIRVDLRATTAGLPNVDDGVVLASRRLAASSLPVYPNAAFVTVNFTSDAVPVDSGQSLALVLIRDFGSGAADVLWHSTGANPDDYANGTACQRVGGSGTAWTAFADDFYFRTRVLTP